MILDKRGKLFGKISIVDIIIVVLILVVAFGTFIRFNGGIVNKTTDTVKISYKISLDGVRIFSYNALMKNLANGENVAYGDKGIVIGKIVDVQKEGYKATLLKSNGDEIMTEYPPNYYRVTITVEANAINSDSGYSVNSINIRKGDLNDYYFATKTIFFAGKVLEVSEV